MTARRTGVRHAITWLGGGVFLAALLQYGLFFAAARQLGLVEYGVFALAFTVAILAAQLCDLGTSVSLVFAGSRCPEDLPRQFGGHHRGRNAVLFPRVVKVEIL